MSAYVYRQNNSGGRWKGPAKYIIVEATTSEDADRGAQYAGAYFDGCSTGDDCSCCGARWSAAFRPDFDTVDEAIADITDNRWELWDENAGDLYVVVRFQAPQIEMTGASR